MRGGESANQRTENPNLSLARNAGNSFGLQLRLACYSYLDSDNDQLYECLHLGFLQYRRHKSESLCGQKNQDCTCVQIYLNQSWYLVDLPGYGYARRGQKGKDQIRTIIEDYILEREQMTNLFVLIDSRLEPQKIDLEFMEWLGENGIPFSIIFTKLDKLSTTKGKDNLSAYQQKLLETWEELPPIFVTSSEKNKGREEVLDYIESINKTLLNS